MQRKAMAGVVLFLIGLILFTFSIDMPVLGYKKIDTSDPMTTTSYNFYGKPSAKVAFEGDGKEALEIFQKQVRVQNIQAGIIWFTLTPFVLWGARERKGWIYGTAFFGLLLLMLDVVLVTMYNNSF